MQPGGRSSSSSASTRRPSSRSSSGRSRYQGEEITQCKPRHRRREFLGFLRQIEKAVPNDLDLHLIVNNNCTHKHTKVRAWLAQRPRLHVHYIPTYASWLNQVERWFGLITQPAIRQSSVSGVNN